jgi:hypothetical protein
MSQNNSHHGRTLLAWDAPEYIRHEKTLSWWIVAGVLVVLSVGAALYFRSWTTAVLAAVLAATYTLLHQREHPQLLTIRIAEHGIAVGNIFHPWNKIRKYWIVHEPHHLENEPPHVSTLHLQLGIGKRVHDEIVVQFGTENPHDIRAAIGDKVWEDKELEESFLHWLERMLKI